MNACPWSSFRRARRSRIAGVCAGLFAGLLLAASPAAAQLSRSGVTKPLIPGALLFGDVAHDPRNDVYLNVMAWGTVWAAFTNSSGDVISTFTAGPAIGGFANNPRVAYSPDLNGGAGGFLVTWHESTTGPNFVHSSVVSYPGGLVALDPGGVDIISGGAVSAPTAGGPSLAYSPEAKKFLVAWTGDGYTAKGRLVSGITGLPEGGVITIGPGNTRDPAVAWNPVTHEFGVGFAGFGAYMAVARVNTSGGVIPASGPFGQSSGTYNTSLAVNAAGHYVLGWSAPGGAFSMELDSSATPLAGFPTFISSVLGTPTSFAFALNPISGTILAVSEGNGTREVPGVELSSTGVPLGIAAPLTDGAGATGAGGSYAPRVGASATAKNWNISYSRYNLGYALANQIIATGSTDQGGGPPAPPLPPATVKPAVTQNPSSVLVLNGAVVTLRASANGSPAPTVLWQVSRDNVNWQNISGGASATTNGGGISTTLTQLMHRYDSGKLYRAVFSNSAGTTIGLAAQVFVAPPVRNDMNGDGRSDLLVWRPSSATWYWFSGWSSTSSVGTLSQGLGGAGDTPMTGDLDGDGAQDPIVWRPGNGMWFWLNSSNAYSVLGQVQFGGPGDVPIVSDFDGDGICDLAIWRPSTGTWYWLSSATGFTTMGSAQWGGSPGDVPLAADTDGDGKSDLVIWRPSEGMWYILQSSAGYSFAGVRMVQWGAAGDQPLVGDFDGDGKDDLSIWRPSNGTWYWLKSSTNYSYATSGAVQWGIASLGDVPLLTDFDGDGRVDITIWRSSTGVWYWLKSSVGYSPSLAGVLGFGGPGDIPIVR